MSDTVSPSPLWQTAQACTGTADMNVRLWLMQGEESPVLSAIGPNNLKY